ncbi:hypothetical protein [Halobacteriovorax sp.]|uniref:hypothetical protein n=1 Tax=Halobacteriovorax sp. TaxID=2020862 RepID=UPI003561B2B2
MKSLLAILTISLLQPAYAGLKPNRKALYRCVSLNHNSPVDDAYILQSRFGNKRVFHEIKINTLKDGRINSYFKKVNLLSKYDGKVQTYTTGNFRIRIDKVMQASDGNYSAFARIPSHDIHSKNWSCKDFN